MWIHNPYFLGEPKVGIKQCDYISLAFSWSPKWGALNGGK